MKKILFVSHDANRAGAQLFLLNVVQYLSKNTEWKSSVLFLDEGILIPEFKQCARLLYLPKINAKKLDFLPSKLKTIFIEKEFEKQKQALISVLKEENFDLIYANTVATASVFWLLKTLEKPIVSHFHELPFSINLYSKEAELNEMLESSTKIIGCSNAVSSNLISNYPIPADKVSTIHSFVNNEEILKKIAKVDAHKLKQKFKIPAHKKIIISCGNAEYRKGVDLFIEVANAFKNNSNLKNEVVFVWVGITKSGELFEKCLELIQINQIEDSILLIEPTPFAQELISISTIFALTSREDPFPLVMLEAAVCSKPIIAFVESGGSAEFIGKNAGILIQGFDSSKMAIEIDFLLKNEENSKLMGETANKKTRELYNFANSIRKIETLIQEEIINFSDKKFA
jgi:glycosyltransferase involved in cell wall biosynthesis